MKIACVVFDLDGTLVDASADIADALNVAFSQLGVRALTPQEVGPLLGSGPRVLVEKAFGAVDCHIAEERFEQILRDYSEAYRFNPVARTVLLSDAAQALPALRATGTRLGVCTNKRTDIAKRVLDTLSLGELFDAVVGSDRVTHPKPHPGHLLDTLAELDCAPAAALYVGDTTIDAQAAAAAEVAYLHVAWAEKNEESFREITSFAEIMDFVTGERNPAHFS